MAAGSTSITSPRRRSGSASSIRSRPPRWPTDQLRLMFAEGLSTADALTEFSGRGVGTGVVKAAVEALGDAIDIQSVPGRGTRFVLHLPVPQRAA